MPGPFDAVRLGLLEFDLRIHDLSSGGCLIDSLAQVSADRPFRLRLALPDGNSVTVRARVVLPPRDIGYAVRFVDVDDATQEAIERALDFAEKEREPLA